MLVCILSCSLCIRGREIPPLVFLRARPYAENIYTKHNTSPPTAAAAERSESYTSFFSSFLFLLVFILPWERERRGQRQQQRNRDPLLSHMQGKGKGEGTHGNSTCCFETKLILLALLATLIPIDEVGTFEYKIFCLPSTHVLRTLQYTTQMQCSSARERVLSPNGRKRRSSFPLSIPARSNSPLSSSSLATSAHLGPLSGGSCYLTITSCCQWEGGTSTHRFPREERRG